MCYKNRTLFLLQFFFKLKLRKLPTHTATDNFPCFLCPLYYKEWKFRKSCCISSLGWEDVLKKPLGSQTQYRYPGRGRNGMRRREYCARYLSYILKFRRTLTLTNYVDNLKRVRWKTYTGWINNQIHAGYLEPICLRYCVLHGRIR